MVKQALGRWENSIQLPDEALFVTDSPISTSDTSFADLGLSQVLQASVAEAGYESPTPIQAQAIPPILEGRDVLGIARTGSGKTAGFTLPMLERLAGKRARARMPRALILEPTRELAAQVEESLATHGKRHRLTYALIIGGTSMQEQQDRLQKGVDILVATPGRLLDLFGRGQVLLADTKFFVIDEADRMLDMGFIPDIEKITRLLPRVRQTLLFSATLPQEIKSLANSFLHTPVEVSVDAPSSATTSVEQRFERVGERERMTRLEDLLDDDSVVSALIFCNRKTEVRDLVRSLRRHGHHDLDELHGNLTQPERMEALRRFRKHEVRILICSDVAARGLDIPQVSHVFNWDLPYSGDDYVHRIGRTGRAGRTGVSVSFVGDDDEKRLADIVKVLPQESRDEVNRLIEVLTQEAETRDDYRPFEKGLSGGGRRDRRTGGHGDRHNSRGDGGGDGRHDGGYDGGRDGKQGGKARAKKPYQSHGKARTSPSNRSGGARHQKGDKDDTGGLPAFLHKPTKR